MHVVMWLLLVLALWYLYGALVAIAVALFLFLTAGVMITRYILQTKKRRRQAEKERRDRGLDGEVHYRAAVLRDLKVDHPDDYVERWNEFIRKEKLEKR
jgi:uncharacterized membrane protein